MIDTNLMATLEQLMGPHIQAGCSVAQAENVAKIEAFNEGKWEGVACDRCHEMFPILFPWREVGDDVVVNLCRVCGGPKAIVMQADARAVRCMARSKGPCLVCRHDGPTYDGRCWPCAHRYHRGQSETRSYQHRDLPGEDRNE